MYSKAFRTSLNHRPVLLSLEQQEAAAGDPERLTCKSVVNFNEG